jgi:hypothetical protein
MYCVVQNFGQKTLRMHTTWENMTEWKVVLKYRTRMNVCVDWIQLPQDRVQW